MYSFKNDYSEGAIPEIMELMNQTNFQQSVGYGEDEVCMQAVKEIKNALKNDTCDVHFLVGGTQSNLTIIASILRPFECVISADSGHINVHETGAIEATGHKVLIADSVNGKLYPDGIRKVFQMHNDEHMVKPAMVYISNATEVGTIYKKSELIALHDVCKELGLYLFMDGARLGSALSAQSNDVLLEDLCNFVDVFYIGGTKNGALFGEAVVIVNEQLKSDFRYMIKQRGGMLAKGRLLGIQFLGLFKNNRFLEVAKHANEMAKLLQDAFIKHGYKMYIMSDTNQIFPILPNQVIEQLEKEYLFQDWEVIDDDHRAMRFVTSWATPKKEVERFIELLDTIKC